MIRERRVAPRMLAALDSDGAVRTAADNLWRGFSARALAELESAKTDPRSNPATIAHAARTLAIWYQSTGDFERGLENAILLRYLKPPQPNRVFDALLEAECHMHLGSPDLARNRLAPLIATHPKNLDLKLAFCNTLTSLSGETSHDAERLGLINEIFESHGLAGVELLDDRKALALDNIRGKVPAGSAAGGSKITVIVPSYNAEKRLGKTLDCLLTQTWSDLEIIVVDDDSSDGTFAVAQAYSQQDPRVIALRQNPNAGTYSARNLALKYATGEFVTVHDDDDWSHPERLALQATHLVENPSVPANITDWVRCLHHLYFRPTARRSATHITQNYSSLLVRRDILLKIGGWDRVRVSADSELMARLELFTGRKIERLMRGFPLSFALDSMESLTRQGPTHIFTIYHGVRRNYQDMAAVWRSQIEPGQAVLGGVDAPRRFPAPFAILPDRGRLHELDLLVASNFSMVGGAFMSTKSYVEAAVQSGLKVGVFQYPRYGPRVGKAPHNDIRNLIQNGTVELVSPGEQVRAEATLLGYPVLLRDVLDRPPIIECRKFGLITNQMASRLYSGGDVQYDPAEISHNAKAVFGVHESTWIPISELVRQLMDSDPRYQGVHAETWNPLIDSQAWLAQNVAWRGRTRGKPIVGRHGRDHYTKWPSDAEALSLAYGVGRACEVRFLGGADCALDVIGRRPGNWTVYPFGARDIREFLAELDFFVHYPHEDYIEEFGRAVLEAMAAGVPAILPPVFRSTFGDAAIYAEPHQVFGVIEELWASETRWLARVEAGRQFVREKCDWSLLAGRLERLVNAL